MRLNIERKILFLFIIFFFGCESNASKIDAKSRKPFTPINKLNVAVPKELKYDDHCIKYNPGDPNSIKFHKSNIYFLSKCSLTS